MSESTKLKELILYVAQKSEGDPSFGATKLNKILFFADFAYYRQNQRSLTGHPYVKLEHGPAPQNFPAIRDEMIAAGELAIQRTERFQDRVQRRAIALRDANLTLFSGDEIALVDQVIAELWNRNARESSELSHRFIGWKVALEGEVIPYQTALIVDRALTEDEQVWATEMRTRLTDSAADAPTSH